MFQPPYILNIDNSFIVKESYLLNNMAINYQTGFQKEFQVKSQYDLQYIKDAIKKHFLDEKGEVCSRVVIGTGLEEITRPKAEDLYWPFENPPKEHGNPLIGVIEDIHSREARGIKFALTSFRHEIGNYVCVEKRLI